MFIGKKWKIESDDIQITVSSKSIARKGKHAGEETWTPEAYFSTLESAYMWIADQEVRETELKDLQTVVKKQKEIYELIRGLRNVIP